MEFLKVEPKYFSWKKKLADLLVTHAQTMRGLFKAHKDVLAHYISNVMHIDLPAEDVEKVYSVLSTCGMHGNLDIFESTVTREVARLQTQMMLERLQRMWQEITGSKSPGEWSKSTKMPILWLPGTKDEMVEIFEILNGKSVRYDKRSLAKSLAYLEGSKDTFAVLKDARRIDEVFLKSAGVHEYGFAIRVDELKDYIAKNLGADAYSWAMQTADVVRLASEFLNEIYRKTLYSEVSKKIDGMPLERAKEYLKELIKKHAVVGLKILKNDRG